MLVVRSTTPCDSVKLLVQIANVVNACRSHAFALQLPLVDEGPLHHLERGIIKRDSTQDGSDTLIILQ